MRVLKKYLGMPDPMADIIQWGHSVRIESRNQLTTGLSGQGSRPIILFCMRAPSLHCSKSQSTVLFPQDLTGEVCSTHYVTCEGGYVRILQGSETMAWKAPKIVEVPCGMEINMYVSATRK